MAKKAVVLFADGFEEVEAITPVDYLRRAGVEVTTVSIGKNPVVTGAHNIQLTVDATLAELAKQGADFWDAVVLPGGGVGSSNLAASKETGALVTKMAAAGKLVCAICAAPGVVLAPLGLLAGKKFTCYPGVEEKVKDGKWSADRVVIDGNLITGRGAGTAGEFAAAIIGKLVNEAEAKKIAESVLL